MIWKLLFLCFLGFISDVLGSGLSDPIVDLGYAQYQGTFDKDSNNTHFLGIRYAAAPTGSFRWREPISPSKVEGVQLANAVAPFCPQASSGTEPFNPYTGKKQEQKRDDLSSEDCLFLNVYIPGPIKRTHGSGGIPVVVYIPSGGYEAGGSTGLIGRLLYTPDDLIQDSGRGVIVVVIQYRLGLFGFLAGAAVKAKGTLNVGLRDQEFALRWIQEHIANFGGDPQRVTIWGDSSGAGSVLQHVIANNGRTEPPLFKAAMTSSTFVPSQYPAEDVIPQNLYDLVVLAANCSMNVDSLSCLRAADGAILEAANEEICANGFFGTFAFVPVIDGSFVTQSPTAALQQRKVNGDFLLSVTNTFEGSVFVDSATTIQVSEFLAQLFPKFDPGNIRMAMEIYSNLGTPLSQKVAIMGESIFICPTYSLLRAFPNKSYKGLFAVPPGQHGDDLAYYFPSANADGSPPYNNSLFQKAFSESFMNFAREWDPNAKFEADITPAWRKWDENEEEMLFNHTDSGDPIVKSTPTSRALLRRCSFWESVAYLTGH